MSDTGMAKAVIINLDTDKAGEQPIRCMFNPKEYSFTKQNKWAEGKNAPKNMPAMEFGGGQPATLQMQLFFDTYAAREDVRGKYTDAIWELMLLDKTFQQIEDTKQLRPQNPTSGGVGGERVWRVNAGDTLAWIAYQEYGDSTLWRPIADANRLTNVRRLTPGTMLVIPNA